MNDHMKQSRRAVMNEYITVTIGKDLFPLCCDCYRALGWDMIETKKDFSSFSVKLARDRKIKNRTELCNLQRDCESAFTKIEKLERQKTGKATGVAIGVGLLGTVFMAGGTFAYLGSLVWLCVVLAIPGFICWSVPVPIYRKIVRNETSRFDSLIEESYDVIYNSCEKASELLD